jgi:hypothetical protein
MVLRPVLILVVACLAGCTGETTILGYHFGSRARPDVKTVRVPIFRNTTYFRDIEYELTQAVIKRIQDTTPYKVITDGPADAQLTGVIRVGLGHVGIQNELNEARSRDFTLAVEVTFMDTRSGQDYFLPVTQQPALPPAPPTVNLDPLAPPPPVPHLKPHVVAKSATYAPELGQSFATAKQKVIDDIAIHIVNMMECPW